jgi:chemotaxis family two-component system response regulator PixG
MHTQASLPPQYLLKYAVVKKTQLITALKRLTFSGQLIWVDSSGQEWTFLLDQGKILYGTGNRYSTKRWRRCIRRYYPEFKLDVQTLKNELADLDRITNCNCWEYELLYAWMMRGKISEQHMVDIIQAIFEEVLFDLVQAGNTTYRLERSPIRAMTEPSALPAAPLIGINEDAALSAVQRLWQAWIAADLTGYAPILAPIITQQNQIYAATSPEVYEMLTTLLDGENSLRDLAVKTQRDLLQLTQALQPYLQLEWVELVAPPEQPAPTFPAGPRRTPAIPFETPIIACIDDSPLICQTLERVVQTAGYRFIGITEASRAIAILLAKKPNLIFLDLVMPETNGYEICSQLRKVTLFKETPIIILTGNDGIVDQVRARLLGASDFLSKPMEPAVILNAIQKHLGQGVLI